MIYHWRCTRAEIICHIKISLKSGMKYVVKKKKKMFEEKETKKILKLMHSHEIDALMLQSCCLSCLVFIHYRNYSIKNISYCILCNLILFS